MLDSRKLTRRLVALGGIVAAALLPLALNQYWAYTVSQILVFAIALLGLTLITGLLGQPSLMHAELMGFGGFLAGALVANAHLNFWLATLLAVAAGYLLGSIVGLPALRIRGLALAVVTLAIARVFDQLVFPLSWFSGGVGGRAVARPTIPGLNLASDRVYYEILLVAFLLVLALVLAVRRGRIGRVFQAIRETESGAAASGVPLTRYKLLGFSLAAAIAALAGALGAGLDQTVTIQQYPWTKSLVMLAILTIMGASSAQGTLYGAIFIVLSPQGLERVPGLTLLLGKEAVRQLVPLISGGALILQTILAPRGLVPSVGAWLRRSRAREGPPGGAGAEPPGDEPAMEVATLVPAGSDREPQRVGEET
ncbi:MAG: branched-chain amino acid ABC transporter permease [Actinomycetota bacterium]